MQAMMNKIWILEVTRSDTRYKQIYAFSSAEKANEIAEKLRHESDSDPYDFAPVVTVRELTVDQLF